MLPQVGSDMFEDGSCQVYIRSNTYCSLAPVRHSIWEFMNINLNQARDSSVQSFSFLR